MNKRYYNYLIITLIFVILLITIYKVQPQTEIKEVRVPVPVPVQVHTVEQPEFRGPPIKQYKPKRIQQMGLLSNSSETLPLYGKETIGYRDRYNYYTTTPGDQIYPIPITYEDRDCTEDIGCKELYDNQDVSVFGKSGTYKTKIYRTDYFF